MLAFKKQGKGKYFYKNGDYYEGEWVRNKREGRGILLLKSSDVRIEGKFLKD
jgi:hypothetical protein